MKISSVIALSLTMISTHSQAFQTKEMAYSASTDQSLKPSVVNLRQGGYDIHPSVNMSIDGQCSSMPVAGCSCAFCTALRSNALK
jgi:hypothetical protein